ncbi:MAG: GerMN domain-containing protein [Cyanobacteria bacterium J06597_1]
MSRDKLELAEFGPCMSTPGRQIHINPACPSRLSLSSKPSFLSRWSDFPYSMGAVQTKLAIGLALGVGVLGWVGWGLSRALQQSVSVYWLTDANSDIHYVVEERRVNALSSDRALAAGLNILLDGHPQDQLLSAVPTDTELLGARQEGDEIYLDFSEEFASGGGATSLLGRVTQVLYTATGSTPAAKVWISVEGEPVEVLSGDGLLVEQPLTRDSFPPNFKDYIASPQDLEQALESNPDPNSEFAPNADPDTPEPLRDPESLGGVNGTGGTPEDGEPSSGLLAPTI